MRFLWKALEGIDDRRTIQDPTNEQTRNPWLVHRLCLESASPDASHLLILQDDCLLQPGWWGNLLRAIRDQPESIICLFVPGFGREKLAMQRAVDRGERYIPFRVQGFLPLVATLYPMPVVRDLLGWSDNPRLRGADDAVVARYCRFRRLQPIATVPCLVDHDDSIPSVGGRKHSRAGTYRRAAML